MSEVSKVVGEALNMDDLESAVDSVAQKAVEESLSRRLSGLIPSDPETLAAKYMDMPIKDLLSEQKKIEGNIETTKKVLDMIINREYGRCMVEFENSKFITLSQEQAEDQARVYVRDCIIGSRGTTEREKAVHKEYDNNMIELRNLKKERNAVLVAKQAYIDKNSDIIKAELDKRRLKELQESGLLDELDIE
jgi:hypothetical protein